MPDTSNSFVGRNRELTELAAALTGSRLVTLTGTAGVGKSRLALHAVTQEKAVAAEDGEPDACWVALRSLRDEALLAEAVADALGLADHTARTGVDALCGWVGERSLLLVLDCCEHLLPACRTLVQRLLSSCPGLSIVATSRQALRVEGEHVLPVEPLTPERAGLALFAHRASEAGAQVRGEEERELARRLCARLDGIPLAIELAAAHLRTLSLPELAERVHSGLELSGAGAPTAPGHEQTGGQADPQHAGARPADAVRDAVRWSHDLCDEGERAVWARLSLLRGTFDAGTARATAAGAPLTGPDDVDRALTGLVGKSVVTLDRDRYRMLDSIRDFGQGQLTALGEESATADRHAAYLRGLARQAHQEWLGPFQASWYERTGDLFTNTCTAIDHLLATDAEAALELVADIGFFWVCDGHLHEVKHYLLRGLSASPAPGLARVRALWLLSLCRLLTGEHEAGLQDALRCREAALAEGDAEVVRQAAYVKGLGELLQGRADAALATSGTALADAATSGDPSFARGTVMCRLVRAFALTGAGKLTEARREAESLRELCVRHREYWTRSYTDYQLALIALFEERADDAVLHARAMLDAKLRIGDSFGIAMGMDITAIAWARLGEAHRAALAYGAGHQFWQLVGHPQRGTPEVAPLREHSEALARAALGDAAYDEAFDRAAKADPDSMAEWLAHGLPMPLSW